MSLYLQTCLIFLGILKALAFTFNRLYRLIVFESEHSSVVSAPHICE